MPPCPADARGSRRLLHDREAAREIEVSFAGRAPDPFWTKNAVEEIADELFGEAGEDTIVLDRGVFASGDKRAVLYDAGRADVLIGSQAIGSDPLLLLPPIA